MFGYNKTHTIIHHLETHAHTQDPTNTTSTVRGRPSTTDHRSYSIRTALQHAAYEWGNSAPAIVPDRRAKRRCGQPSSANWQEKLHLFAVSCVVHAADMHISACLPASLLPNVTACVLQQKSVSMHPLFFFSSVRIVACPD